MEIAARSYAQVRWSALAELAECLGDARLEWLRGRERNILRQRESLTLSTANPVPTANSIWLASNAESGDASAQ